MKEILQEMLHQRETGRGVVLVSIVAESGSTPRGAGAKMLVMEDGQSLGTIGGGAIEYNAQQLAAEVLQSHQSRLQEYNLSPNDAAGLGMVCGGQATVYLQWVPPGAEAAAREALALLEARRPFVLLSEIESGEMTLLQPGGTAPLAYASVTNPKSHLCEAGGRRYLADPVATGGRALLFGMGHVGAELVPVLHRLHFYTLAMDDREEYLTAERLPLADERRLVDFPTALDGLDVQKEDFIVILTRGHKHDYVVLTGALRSPARYIGMIGSRAKVAMSKKALAGEGFGEADIARLHAPVGLPLGGESPEEIAVSIAAEMIRERAGYRER